MRKCGAHLFAWSQFITIIKRLIILISFALLAHINIPYYLRVWYKSHVMIVMHTKQREIIMKQRKKCINGQANGFCEFKSPPSKENRIVREYNHCRIGRFMSCAKLFFYQMRELFSFIYVHVANSAFLPFPSSFNRKMERKIEKNKIAIPFIENCNKITNSKWQKQLCIEIERERGKELTSPCETGAIFMNFTNFRHVTHLYDWP